MRLPARISRRCAASKPSDSRISSLFSPSAGQLEARTLADWIIEEKLPVRFQTQLHKLLWGEEPGR